MDITQIQKSLFVNEDTLDDLEDEEEYPLPIQNSNIQMQMQNNNIIQASKEYIDAVSIISTKSWDHASWLTYVEEVCMLQSKNNILSFWYCLSYISL